MGDDTFPAVMRSVLATVATSVTRRDPDYDIVSYRYRWTVGGRVVRQVTTAALTDAIPTGSVLPADGRLRGGAQRRSPPGADGDDDARRTRLRSVSPPGRRGYTTQPRRGSRVAKGGGL